MKSLENPKPSWRSTECWLILKEDDRVILVNYVFLVECCLLKIQSLAEDRLNVGLY